MNKFLIFLSGAAIGSLITLCISKKVYQEAAEKRADEEIESVKAAFKKLEEEDKKKKETEKAADVALKEYQTSDSSEDISVKADSDEDEPYIIKPDDYGEETDYEIVSLLYYARNSKLAYMSGGIVEHPEDLFDVEFLNRFGEYEENMLYVRDPKEKIDYDIEYLNERYNE